MSPHITFTGQGVKRIKTDSRWRESTFCGIHAGYRIVIYNYFKNGLIWLSGQRHW